MNIQFWTNILYIFFCEMSTHTLYVYYKPSWRNNNKLISCILYSILLCVVFMKLMTIYVWNYYCFFLEIKENWKLSILSHCSSCWIENHYKQYESCKTIAIYTSTNNSLNVTHLPFACCLVAIENSSSILLTQMGFCEIQNH